ncbi:hypothetical protein ACFOLD_03095 [Kocuria carniphila]
MSRLDDARFDDAARPAERAARHAPWVVTQRRRRVSLRAPCRTR